MNTQLVSWFGLSVATKRLVVGMVSLAIYWVAGSSAESAPVPHSIREKLQLAPFYQQYVDAGGMPIVSSAKVNPAALTECEWIVTNMLASRPEVLKALGEAHVRFVVMAWNEYTTDLPEQAHLEPRVYWDRRARGLGASEELPVVSCGEENLLSYPGDPYPTENIGIHEFAHAVHDVAMKRLDAAFDSRVAKAYTNALARGLWKNTYAAVNRHEYWAEASQSWFDDNRENDSLHNFVNTRVELKAYDPEVAALCREVFGDRPWRYKRPGRRRPEERAHLAGFQDAKSPRFEWRKEPVPAAPRFRADCSSGEIEIELTSTNQLAPVAAFLQAIQLGYYSNGEIIRRGEVLNFQPGLTQPTGEAVPAGEGRWSLSLSSNAPGSLTARILSGGKYLPAGDSTAPLPLQRVTRLN